MFKPNTTMFEPQPEQACKKVIYSGGGFSNYFGMPDYQRDAVGGRLQQHKAKYVDNGIQPVQYVIGSSWVVVSHLLKCAVEPYLPRYLGKWRQLCRGGSLAVHEFFLCLYLVGQW